jgi:hypothetical protein
VDQGALNQFVLPNADNKGIIKRKILLFFVQYLVHFFAAFNIKSWLDFCRRY